MESVASVSAAREVSDHGAGDVPRRRAVAASLAVFLLLLCLVVALQAWCGAYGSEAGSGADEPSHVISGLLVRDYLAAGMPEGPMRYAREYYAHYPKVAIGNWPPLFYLLQGVWTLIFPAAMASLVLLMGVLTAAVAWLCWAALRPRVAAAFAFLGPLVFVLARPVPSYASWVMGEMPLTLFVVLAVLCWGRYLERGRGREVAGFGAFALLAAMTKGNGLLLALVPPLTIVLGGRWRLLRSRVLWATAVPVAVVAGIWFSSRLPVIRAGWESTHFSGDYVRAAVSYYPGQLLSSLGWVLAGVAAVGIWARVLRRPAAGGAGSGLWDAALAAIVAVVAFHALIPSGREVRFLVPAYPFVAMFVAAGAAELARVLTLRGVGRAAAAGAPAVLVTAALLIWSFRPPGPGLSGFARAAAEIGRGAAPGGATSMVASDATGEGVWIVQVALHDRRRPASTVWRGSKLLSRATWAGRDYEMRAHSDTAVLRLLERAGIGTLLVDLSAPALPHDSLLRATIAAHPERFVPLRTLPVERAGRHFPGGIRLYRFLPAPGTAAPRPSLRQVPGYEGVETIASP